MTDRSARLLERALLFTFVIHGVAMASMVLCLLPGLPGGGGAGDLARLRYVADHPWLWRLGWFPWQLTALSDLVIGIGLLRATWIPKVPAAITMILTIAAVAPDQAGQVLWMTQGIELARSGDAAAYLAFESRIFEWIAVWAGVLYTVAALGWTWCFAAAGAWSPLLTGISVALWPLFLYANGGPKLPAAIRPPAELVAAGNALGFLLLQVWFALVAERVLRRSRPDAPHGRQAPWRHPGGLLGRAADLAANSRFLRALAEIPPPIAMVSDITDVIYVNYVVDAGRLAPLVPEGLELQKVGADGRWSVFTFLTFRHGRFGPRLLGPLRRLLPSPIHTNWRIHVRDPRTGKHGIHFVTNAIASTPHALAARLLSEGMPMHVPASAELRSDGGRFILRLEPGRGSSPDVDAELRPAVAPASGPWSAAFPSWNDMLAYVVPQDRGFSTQPWHGRVTRQEIRLDIPVEACEPLEGRVSSRAAAEIVGDATPFCFRVAAVRFRFEAEEYDPL